MFRESQFSKKTYEKILLKKFCEYASCTTNLFTLVNNFAVLLFSVFLFSET